VIDGNGASSATPAASKIMQAECRQSARLHVTRKPVTPVDFRLPIDGGRMSKIDLDLSYVNTRAPRCAMVTLSEQHPANSLL
jgi:hypothetical protein